MVPPVVRHSTRKRRALSSEGECGGTSGCQDIPLENVELYQAKESVVVPPVVRTFH